MEIEGALGPYVSAGAPVNGTDEVQTITPSAAVASGTWALKFEGFTTTSLAFNISAANLAIALNALPTIGAAGVGVALDAGTGVYTVTFNGANLAKRAQALITVVDSALKDAANAAVTMTVAEGTPGVTATALGAAAGALLIDTTNKTLYQNTGTPAAPTWSKIASGVTVTSAVLNSAVAGVAAGYKIARGVHETVAAVDTVVTGLSTVVAVVVSLESDPVLTCDRATASIGTQAGAPAAGSVYISTWMPTSNADPTPVAATAFSKKVNWIAIGV